jgi:hypothetical protein
MDDLTLTIEFTGFKQVRLLLTGGGQQIDAVDFSFDSNLDTMLIDSLDIILKKNRIDSLSLHKVRGMSIPTARPTKLPSPAPKP